MAETRATNPLVEQFQLGGVPEDLRLMAAQGALPLKPSDLVELLHLLLRDEQPTVAQAAFESLRTYPAVELLPIATDRTTPGPILGWCLLNREEREIREAIIQNTATPDKSIENLAEGMATDLAELVVINQVRLLRSTSLLEALERNQHLNNDQKRRLFELRETFHIGEAPPEPPPEPEPPRPVLPPEPPAKPLSEAEAVSHYLSDDEKVVPEKVSVVKEIYRLNTAQKIIKALQGSREERAVLVRDNNRLVSTAVLGSPKITDAEIEAFANMKSLSDQVLRTIGNNKDWTKRYGVILNLVKNPRTPVGVSLGMVPRLNPRDIKGVAVDRNIPDVIRKQAERFIRGKADKKD
jgi:hypothetical protein